MAILPEHSDSWAIPQPFKDGDEVSDTCVQSQDRLLTAARNCREALDLMASMNGPDNRHLVTALKKYVEDTCEAIKQIDNLLRAKGTSLEKILVEIPGESKGGLSWKSIVGLRDVLAHKLKLDNTRFYREASQSCAPLYDLLARVYFAPVKTHTTAGEPLLSPSIKREALVNLVPYGDGEDRTPEIAKTLVFICENRSGEFLFFRVGRTTNSKQLLIWFPPGSRWTLNKVIGLKRSG